MLHIQMGQFLSCQALLLSRNGANVTTEATHHNQNIVKCVTVPVLARGQHDKIHENGRKHITRDGEKIQRSIACSTVWLDRLTHLTVSCMEGTSMQETLVIKTKLVPSL